jgi:alanine racemase
VLVLSEPAPAAMGDVVRFGLTPTCYTRAGLAAAAQAVETAGGAPLPVHIKVDTGMHRVGAEPAAAAQLVAEVRQHRYLTLGGVCTHLAVADELDNPYTDRQLQQFNAAVAAMGERPPLLHAANSAGALWHPAGRFDLVRCGIALYGLAPSAAQLHADVVGRLRPAMSLRARVSFVKTLDAGAQLSYGLRYQLAERSVVATVPLGYADGVPRRLGQEGGEVLIGGRRCPIAGTVTMDQLLVDCGPEAAVSPGDEVVLIGSQRGAGGALETVGAWEWAQRTGTIAYEVVCGISERVPRRHV